MDVESVLVTGANRGIGLEFIRQIVNSATPPEVIFATFRNGNEITALKDIKESSKKCSIYLIQMDVTVSDDIVKCFRIVEEIVGANGLTLLINNAGVLVKDSFPVVTDDNMLFHFKCNVLGPINMMKAFLPLLAKAADRKKDLGKMSFSRGGVLNISGLFGSITNLTEDHAQFPGLMAYRVSKAALNMAMRVAATTMRDQGILVVLVCPGWVRTDMGTANGLIDVTDSVSDILKTVADLDDSHHGLFISRSGEVYPF